MECRVLGRPTFGSIEQNTLRNLVTWLPKYCLIAKILLDCQNLAWLPNSRNNSYTYFARKTLDLGVMGGNIEPPQKQWIRRTSDLACFLEEYFSTFIFYSHVDTIFTWLKLAIIKKLSRLLRREFFWRRRRLKHNIKSFVGGCAHKIFPTLQENVKGFSSFLLS